MGWSTGTPSFLRPGSRNRCEKGWPRLKPEGSTDALVDLVDGCTSPSEAFWRTFELAVLEEYDFPRPVLELGCGDGAFTALLGIAVDEGVDLNPRAVERARALSQTYGAVHCIDIRAFPHNVEARFATIFANSVLEHIPEVETVLRVCQRLLKPSGRLIFTVPLVDMNRHLFIRAAWYAEFRRRQLQHHNLWSIDEWRNALDAAGFEGIEVVPYLPGFQCGYWDRIDFLGDLGVGRYRVATAVRRLGSLVLPKAGKLWVSRHVTTHIRRQLEATSDSETDMCAALLIATKT